MKRVVLLAVVCFLIATHSVRGASLTMTMVTDEPLKGKAILTGSILDLIVGTSESASAVAKLSGGGSTLNWSAGISISRLNNGFVLEVEGRHITAPAPHKDQFQEVSPGPFLDAPNYLDITGTGAGPGGTLDRLVSQTHLAGPHKDFMVTHLSDLNPNSTGVVGGGVSSLGQIQMSIDFSHETPIPVPLPPALIPGLIGFLCVVFLQCRRRLA